MGLVDQTNLKLKQSWRNLRGWRDCRMKLCSRTRHPIMHARSAASPIFDKTFLTPMCEFRVPSLLKNFTPMPLRARNGDSASPAITLSRRHAQKKPPKHVFGSGGGLPSLPSRTLREEPPLATANAYTNNSATSCPHLLARVLQPMFLIAR